MKRTACISPLLTTDCLFSSTFAPYIESCRRKPAMAINGRRNKPFGPGGSTRRLHQSGSPPMRGSEPGCRRGRNRIDEGVKGVLLLGMVPPLSGQLHSCQRQLCSGCSGRVSGSKDRTRSPDGLAPSGGVRRHLATEASTSLSRTTSADARRPFDLAAASRAGRPHGRRLHPLRHPHPGRPARRGAHRAGRRCRARACRASIISSSPSTPAPTA